MNADGDLQAKLREVVDRQEIHQALMRYSRGVDRQQEAMVNSVFDVGGINDGGTPLPATHLAKRVADIEPLPRMHFIGNVLIELEGDTAYAETYFIAYSSSTRDGKPYTRTRAGRWLDRFERRADGWKIANRRVVDEWARLDEVRELPAGLGGHRGVSGSGDAVFQMRELLKEGPQ